MIHFKVAFVACFVVNENKSIIGEWARVHPDFSGKGIYRALTRFQYDYMKRKYKSVENFAGTSTNKNYYVSLKHAKQLVMEWVSIFYG